MPAANSAPSSSTPSSPPTTGSCCSAPATTCAPTPTVPPVVAVAELLDVVDATVRAPDGGPARRLITVDHPRQAWARHAFVAGALDGEGPWSFDTGALAAAWERRHTTDTPPFLPTPLDELRSRRPRPPRCAGRCLHQAGRGPLATAPGREPGRRAQRPRRPHPPHARRPRSAGSWPTPSSTVAWTRRGRGARRRKPPGNTTSGGGGPCHHADSATRPSTPPPISPSASSTPWPPSSAPRSTPPSRSTSTSPSPAVDGPWQLTGRVAGVCGSTLVMVTASRLKAKHLLTAWVRLAAVVAGDPDRPWKALTIGRAATGRQAHGAVTLTSHAGRTRSRCSTWCTTSTAAP